MEDLTSPRVLRETLGRYGLTPRRRLGQNFLIDANLRDKIVSYAALVPGDLVLEVGSGPGALTPELVATGAAVLAIEVDPGLARVLADRLPPQPGRFELVVGDLLRLDLAEIVGRTGFAGRPAVAVANLPYYITTPAVFRLLEADLPWRSMILLVQREVAERIVAAPGNKDYGLLTVTVGCRAEPEILRILPPSVFWPPPRVHSALVRLAFPSRHKLAPPVQRVLTGLARAAFGQRRKTLANACRAWTDGLGLRAEFASICGAIGLDSESRGEDLSVDDFVRLARTVANRLGEAAIEEPGAES